MNRSFAALPRGPDPVTGYGVRSERPRSLTPHRIAVPRPLAGTFITVVLLLAGCTGTPTAGENRARHDHESIERGYRPSGRRPDLPRLEATSPVREFLLYAILNQPQIEAAYFEWAASVERITVERSLPDPRLTFQADIADMVLSLMPGVMMDFPGAGKLKAAAAATAESEAKYFAFESSVLQTAFAFRKAYYQLKFLAACRT